MGTLVFASSISKIFGKSGASGFDPDDFHQPTLSTLESTQHLEVSLGVDPM